MMSESPKEAVKPISGVERFFKGILIAIGLLMIYYLAALAMPVLVLIEPLAIGWVQFPLRVLPKLALNGPALSAFLICAAVLIFGLHRFITWVRAHAGDGKAWRWRWTLGFVALGFVVISQLIAAGLVFHQIGWLMTHKRPLFQQNIAIGSLARLPFSDVGKADWMIGMLQHDFSPEAITRGLSREQLHDLLGKNGRFAECVHVFRVAFVFTPDSRLHGWIAVPRDPELAEKLGYAICTDAGGQRRFTIAQLPEIMTAMEKAAGDASPTTRPAE